MKEGTVEAGGLPVAFYEWGDDTAWAVLFWHALGDHNGLQVAEVAELLAAERGLRTLAVDAPGFGATPPFSRSDDYKAPALAPFADELLEGLEVEQAVFMGASWGASVGVHVAARSARLSALVLLDAGYQDLAGPAQSLDELRAHWREQPGFRYESWEALFDEGRAFLGRWSLEIETATRASFREQDGEIVSVMGPDLYATVIWALHEEPPSAAWPALAESGTPVLALVATEPPNDRRAEALSRFRAALPHADVRELSGAHHWLLEERPQEVAAIVGDWLDAQR